MKQNMTYKEKENIQLYIARLFTQARSLVLSISWAYFHPKALSGFIFPNEKTITQYIEQYHHEQKERNYRKMLTFPSQFRKDLSHICC